jgi:hypothetical protein
MGNFMSRRRVFVFAAAVATIASTVPSTALGEYDGRLPISPGRLIDPFNGPYPPHASLFAAITGARCVVYWDDFLGTPRYVSMRSKLYLPQDPYSSDPSVLIAGAQALIDGTRDFFGVGSGDLISPTVYRAGKSRIIAFREAAGGVAIRGANLRIIVGEDGAVRAIKAFLLRDPPATAWDFAPFEGLAPALDGWGAGVTYSEPQLYFPRYDPDSLRPVWNMWASDAEEHPWEYFFDAGTGLPIERRILRAEFPVKGSVKGIYPDPRRLHATADKWTGDASVADVPFWIEGARIEEQLMSKSDVAVSGPDGSFTIDVPGDPQDKVSLECKAEYWRCGVDMRGSVQSNCDPQGMIRLLKVVWTADCRTTDLGTMRQKYDPMMMDQQVDFVFNLSPKPSFEESFQLMALQHMSRFMDDFLTRAKIIRRSIRA